MNEENIKNIIIESLREIAPDTDPSTLQPDDIIRDKLYIDSYDALQFIVTLDDKLGVDIPEEDYGKIMTMKQLMAYIKAKKKA